MKYLQCSIAGHASYRACSRPKNEFVFLFVFVVVVRMTVEQTVAVTCRVFSYVLLCNYDADANACQCLLDLFLVSIDH